ncbi:phosphoglycolate phosphatase [Haloparvum alkalitolerans]|uniref:phosphoglycolate phosphatase n=1 Tax=Haloparvum alkalitolerans TaxID=1042953 RepID=UPI003CF7C162
MVPPLVLDIDGTLTTPEHRVDRRVFELLPGWDAPVVFATGKSFPYPVALAHFLGLPENVVAENGGVVYADGETTLAGDAEACWEAVEEFHRRGGDLGWGTRSTVNRWRETEVAASHDADEDLLREVAAGYDLEVVDTGYAYHVKTPGVSKGAAFETLCETLRVDPERFVAVGDSVNDVSTFAVAGESYAVANADEAAREAADRVLEAGYMDGTAAVLEALREGAAGP